MLVQFVELSHTDGSGCDFTGASLVCMVRKQRARTENKARQRGAESVNASALTPPAAAVAA
eukprot:6210600-Pleurochrysis_carterae.AAC.1